MPRVKVSCESCGLIAKIDEERVALPCEECGGELSLFDTAPAIDTVVCDGCGADNAVSAKFCESCGERLASAGAGVGAGEATAPGARAPSARRPRGKASRAKGDKLDRRQANIELGKAFKTLKRVRAFYITLALLQGVLLLFAVAGLGQRQALQTTGAEAALWYGGAMLLFFIVGAALLPRQPFAWSLTLALVVTPYGLYGLVAGILFLIAALSAGVPGVVGILMVLLMAAIIFGIPVLAATACWFATARLAGFKKLLAENKDTVSAQRIRGKRREAGPGSLTTKVREREVQQMQGGWKVAIYAGAAVLVVVAIVVLSQMSGTRNDVRSDEVQGAERNELVDKVALRQSFQPVLTRFLAAWEASDSNGIGQFIPASQRETVLARLRRTLDRWSFSMDKLPAIENRRDLWGRRDPNVVKCYFSIPATRGGRRAKLRTEWHRTDDKWVLLELYLRKTKTDD